jgi:hypothetical protein
MFLTKVAEDIETHFMFNNIFLKSWRLRDNVEKFCRTGQATDGNIIGCMRPACWIPKATNTHSEYEINIAIPMLHLLYKSN